MSAATMLDQVIEACALKNDAALARRLESNPATISKIRTGIIHVSAPLMVRIHEETGWPTKHIKALIGGDVLQEGGRQ